MSNSEQQRHCPDCGSDQVTLVQRGLTGATDEHDQYFSCIECGRVTYEIISRTPREIRVGRLEPGRLLKLNDADYVVSRVLKVGLNESLVYLKPADDRARPGGRYASATRLPPRRR